ncbi:MULTISPECIES: GNAT family N-acetyltransferase [unclassified Frankia]|uniref:GNAT family N-acetyltransferase n=1 Tax=unclassified Frankia TaxID=2632575 RepID=UPI001EF5E417|nr:MULTISPECIES: GNAT family N-acetyltransferase [unclassified Frankia]
MPVTVRRATEDDLRKVYLLLSTSTLNSAPLSFEMRARMFRPVWGGTEGYYGYVMEDGDEVVGFLGLLFTQREIRGASHRFCEIHSWYVREQYRNESLRLFLPALSVRKATLVNYTPTETVYEISKKFGFEDLESRLLLLYPVPTPAAARRAVRVETRRHVIAQYLDEADRRIFLDHENVACQHYLVRGKNDTEYLYVIAKKMWLKPYRPFGRIMYASNKAKLLAHLDYLRLFWCARLAVPLMVIDEDELDGAPRPAFSRQKPREVPSLYKSKDLKAEDIRPPLYTLPLLIGYRLH